MHSKIIDINGNPEGKMLIENNEIPTATLKDLHQLRMELQQGFQYFAQALTDMNNRLQNLERVTGLQEKYQRDARAAIEKIKENIIQNNRLSGQQYSVFDGMGIGEKIEEDSNIKSQFITWYKTLATDIEEDLQGSLEGCDDFKDLVLLFIDGYLHNPDFEVETPETGEENQ